MRNVKYGKRENVDAGSEYIIMSALTIFIRNVKYGRETKMNAVWCTWMRICMGVHGCKIRNKGLLKKK